MQMIEAVIKPHKLDAVKKTMEGQVVQHAVRYNDQVLTGIKRTGDRAQQKIDKLSQDRE